MSDVRFGEYVPNNIKNKILFIPDFENNLPLFHKVCSEFLEYSFANPDSELIVVVNGLYEVGHYIYHYIFRIAMPGVYRVRYVIRHKVDIFALLGEVQYYVPSNYGKEELDILDEAFEHDVKILPPFAENIFSSLPINEKCVQEKVQLAKALYGALIQKYSPDEYDYFLYHQGLGETMITFYLLKEYKERFRRKIIFLCMDPSRTHVFEQCPYVDVTATIDARIFAYIAIFWSKKYNVKNGLEMWFAPYSSEYAWPSAPSSNNMITTVRRFMGLPVWSGLEKYPVEIFSVTKSVVKNKIDELKIRQGKTFFLVTDAISEGNSGLNVEFWKKVVRELEHLGYDVVVSSQDSWGNNIKNAYFRPFEAVEFVNYCGNIISVCTGILDVIGCLGNSNLNAYRIIVDNIKAKRANFPPWVICNLPALYYENVDVKRFIRNIDSYQSVLWGEFSRKIKTYIHNSDTETLWKSIKNDIIMKNGHI